MIEGQLNGLGLECQRAGRRFAAQATNADLLIIDLFLASAQQTTWNHLDPGPLACVVHVSSPFFRVRVKNSIAACIAQTYLFGPLGWNFVASYAVESLLEKKRIISHSGVVTLSAFFQEPHPGLAQIRSVPLGKSHPDVDLLTFERLSHERGRFCIRVTRGLEGCSRLV